MEGCREVQDLADAVRVDARAVPARRRDRVADARSGHEANDARMGDRALDVDEDPG